MYLATLVEISEMREEGEVRGDEQGESGEKI